MPISTPVVVSHHPHKARRHFLKMSLGSLGITALGLSHSYLWAQSPSPVVEVWKSPSCGCCKDWMAHLEQHGFKTRTHDVGNTAMRAKLGVPMALGSCHTALVDGYVIEGHVPAADIRRLLKERPMALGLTVPGMPIGSPGMNGPEYQGRRDSYEVLLIEKNGQTRVFRRYA